MRQLGWQRRFPWAPPLYTTPSRVAAGLKGRSPAPTDAESPAGATPQTGRSTPSPTVGRRARARRCLQHGRDEHISSCSPIKDTPLRNSAMCNAGPRRGGAAGQLLPALWDFCTPTSKPCRVPLPRLQCRPPSGYGYPPPVTPGSPGNSGCTASGGAGLNPLW